MARGVSAFRKIPTATSSGTFQEMNYFVEL